MRQKLFQGLVLVVVLALSACSVKEQKDPIQQKNLISKEAWIAKTSDLLLLGEGFGTESSMTELRKLSFDELLEKWMNHPRFADMVLDFNLYVLGQQENQLLSHKADDEGDAKEIVYSTPIFSWVNAIRSARETAQDGDYLSLFDWKQPLFLEPNSKPEAFLPFYPDEYKVPFPSELISWPEQRAFVLKLFLERMDRAIAFTESLQFPEQKSEYCDFQKLQALGYYLQIPFMSAGLPNFFQFQFISDLSRPIRLFCDDVIELEDKTAPIRKIKEVVSQIFQDFERLDPERYTVTRLQDLQWIKPEVYGISQLNINLHTSFWDAFPNSSTNFNRKRAAYFLSRFFCDDLTPIGFVNPTEHSQDRHASAPSCASCHYKLDPMAGFFKTLGLIGIDYSGRKEIVFDDGARISLEAYLKNWGPTPSGNRPNIGYVRSADDESLNSYGDNLEDLFQIMKEAPEVKACLVKRLGHYLLGEEQMLDPGFVQELTQKFMNESRQSSGKAFKNTVKRYLLSQTYHQTSLDSSQCYDFPAGLTQSELAQRPPCQVAHVLKENCTQCHQGKGAAGGLDLSRWDQHFPHLDGKGTAVPARTTLQRMLTRISSPDKNQQMPPERHFSSKNREILFLWLQKQLESSR